MMTSGRLALLWRYLYFVERDENRIARNTECIVLLLYSALELRLETSKGMLEQTQLLALDLRMPH